MKDNKSMLKVLIAVAFIVVIGVLFALFGSLDNSLRNAVYSPEHKHIKESADLFGADSRQSMLFFTMRDQNQPEENTNMLSKSILKEMLKLHNMILNMEIQTPISKCPIYIRGSATTTMDSPFSHTNKPFKFEDVCDRMFKGKGCTIESPLQHWSFSDDQIDTDMDIGQTLACPQRPLPCFTEEGQPIVDQLVVGKDAKRNEKGDLTYVKSYFAVYTLDGNDIDAAVAWEHEFDKLVDKYNEDKPIIRVEHTTLSAISYEALSEIEHDGPWVGIGILLAICYVCTIIAIKGGLKGVLLAFAIAFLAIITPIAITAAIVTIFGVPLFPIIALPAPMISLLICFHRFLYLCKEKAPGSALLNILLTLTVMESICMMSLVIVPFDALKEMGLNAGLTCIVVWTISHVIIAPIFKKSYKPISINTTDSDDKSNGTSSRSDALLVAHGLIPHGHGNVYGDDGMDLEKGNYVPLENVLSFGHRTTSLELVHDQKTKKMLLASLVKMSIVLSIFLALGVVVAIKGGAVDLQVTDALNDNSSPARYFNDFYHNVNFGPPVYINTDHPDLDDKRTIKSFETMDADIKSSDILNGGNLTFDWYGDFMWFHERCPLFGGDRSKSITEQVYNVMSAEQCMAECVSCPPDALPKGVCPPSVAYWGDCDSVLSVCMLGFCQYRDMHAHNIAFGPKNDTIEASRLITFQGVASNPSDFMTAYKSAKEIASKHPDSFPYSFSFQLYAHLEEAHSLFSSMLITSCVAIIFASFGVYLFTRKSYHHKQLYALKSHLMGALVITFAMILFISIVFKWKKSDSGTLSVNSVSVLAVAPFLPLLIEGFGCAFVGHLSEMKLFGTNTLKGLAIPMTILLIFTFPCSSKAVANYFQVPLGIVTLLIWIAVSYCFLGAALKKSLSSNNDTSLDHAHNDDQMVAQGHYSPPSSSNMNINIPENNDEKNSPIVEMAKSKDSLN